MSRVIRQSVVGLAGLRPLLLIISSFSLLRAGVVVMARCRLNEASMGDRSIKRKQREVTPEAQCLYYPSGQGAHALQKAGIHGVTKLWWIKYYKPQRRYKMLGAALRYVA